MGISNLQVRDLIETTLKDLNLPKSMVQVDYEQACMLTRIDQLMDGFYAGMRSSLGKDWDLHADKTPYNNTVELILSNGSWSDSFKFDLRDIRSVDMVHHIRDRVLDMKARIEVEMGQRGKVRRSIMKGQMIPVGMTREEYDKLRSEGAVFHGRPPVAEAAEVASMLPLTKADVNRIDQLDKHLAEYLQNIVSYRDGLTVINEQLEGTDAEGNPKQISINQEYTQQLLSMVGKFISTIHKAQSVVNQLNQAPASKRHADIMKSVEAKMREIGLL